MNIGHFLRYRYVLTMAFLAVGCSLVSWPVVHRLTAPPPLVIRNHHSYRPPDMVHFNMGGLQSDVMIQQRGFRIPPEEGFPNRDTYIRERFVDAANQLEVIAGFHPCNPIVQSDAVAIDQMGGGRGSCDKFTSGGGLRIRSLGDDTAELNIGFILVGTSAGSCSIDVEQFVAGGSGMLGRVQRLRDRLEPTEQLPQIDATLQTLNDGQVAFVDHTGKCLATATAKDAAWVRQVKAAFRDCYVNPSDAATRRVTYLVLDYVLQEQQFQRAVSLWLDPTS